MFNSGDIVYVNRKPENNEIWNDVWVSKMDKFIGKKFKVLDFWKCGNIRLCWGNDEHDCYNCYNFPNFVLSLNKKAKIPKWKKAWKDQ